MIDRELLLRKLDAVKHHAQTVDWGIVHASITGGLGDFDAFIKAIRKFIDSCE